MYGSLDIEQYDERMPVHQAFLLQLRHWAKRTHVVTHTYAAQAAKGARHA